MGTVKKGCAGYDIFISYAHIDDEPILEGESGWISEFHAILEKRLAMLLGEKPRIWRDPRLRGNDYFDDVISRSFQRATLFVSVLTPRYIKSDYCRKELREFIEHTAKAGMSDVCHKSRLFRVVKTPVAEEENPEPLRTLLGYEFYSYDPISRRLREYRVSSPQYREKYLMLLDDLAQDIAETLKSLRQQRRDTDMDVRAIYLAPTSSDLKDEYETIRRELLERGYAVIPDSALPLESSAFITAVEKGLARSVLSIHMVGSHYGVIPENAEKSVVHLQNDLAAACCEHSDLERLIWIAPDCSATEDDRQTAFIQQLKTKPEALRRACLLSHSVEELKLDIFARLEDIDNRARKRQAPAAGTEAGGRTPFWIYLIHDEGDAAAVASLEEMLWNENIEVRTPLFDEECDPPEIRQEHEENLRLCDGFVIFYGNGNERWLHKSLNDLKKARGLGRDKPILAKIVVVGPPEDEKKRRFRTLEATVIDAGDGDYGKVVQTLRDQMKGT